MRKMDNEIKLAILKLIVNVEKDEHGELRDFTALEYHYPSVYKVFSKALQIAETAFRKYIIEMQKSELLVVEELGLNQGSVKATIKGAQFLMSNINL